MEHVAPHCCQCTTVGQTGVPCHGIIVEGGKFCMRGCLGIVYGVTAATSCILFLVTCSRTWTSMTPHHSHHLLLLLLQRRRIRQGLKLPTAMCSPSLLVVHGPISVVVVTGVGCSKIVRVPMCCSKLLPSMHFPGLLPQRSVICS